MFVVHDDMTIYATRGDVVYFPLEKKNGDAKYKFQPGDIVRFKVFCKKNCGKVVLMKDFLIEEESTAVNIFLDRGEMKFGEIISKPVDYWYEAELNPDTFPDTFIGYDENGAKLFRLYPEAKDVVEGEIDDPEENSAVARMVVTFVNEYLGENAEDTIVKTIDQYFAEHPIKDGEDGENGIGVAGAVIDASGNLKITYTNGETDNLGCVVGKDGKDGKEGFSPIAKVTETDSGAVITITDAEGTTEATVKNGRDGVDGIAGKDGKDGATFTPSVDVSGNLSWSNDGGLPNPATVNIKGEKGDPGEKGDQGDPGADGKPGEPGADGATVQEVLEEMPTVTAMDFSNFENGSFTETVDGSAVSHSVTFDDMGRPTKIDDIAITWEA